MCTRETNLLAATLIILAVLVFPMDTSIAGDPSTSEEQALEAQPFLPGEAIFDPTHAPDWIQSKTGLRLLVEDIQVHDRLVGQLEAIDYCDQSVGNMACDLYFFELSPEAGDIHVCFYGSHGLQGHSYYIIGIRDSLIHSVFSSDSLSYMATVSTDEHDRIVVAVLSSGAGGDYNLVLGLPSIEIAWTENDGLDAGEVETFTLGVEVASSPNPGRECEFWITPGDPSLWDNYRDNSHRYSITLPTGFHSVPITIRPLSEGVVDNLTFHADIEWGFADHYEQNVLVDRDAGLSVDKMQQLATRFLPVLMLDGTSLVNGVPVALYPETFLPEDVSIFMHDGTLKEPAMLPPFAWTVLENPTLSAIGRHNSSDYYINLPGECDWPIPCLPVVEAMRQRYVEIQSAYSTKAYASVIQDFSEDAIIVQYWFFYYINDWVSFHEGDWESIAIVLTASEEPEFASYSAHEGGRRREWGDIEKFGDHPVVYVGNGSHASYFSSGTTGITEIAGLDIGAFPDFHLGNGTCVAPPGVEVMKDNLIRWQLPVEILPRINSLSTSDPAAWLAFSGKWGGSKQGRLERPGPAPLGFLPLIEWDSPVGPCFNSNGTKWLDPYEWAMGLDKDQIEREASIAIIIDTSGSMEPADKLPRVKAAARYFIDRLRAGDEIAVVEFATTGSVAYPLNRIFNESPDHHVKIAAKNAVDGLSPGGGTNFAGGLQLAYEQLTNSDAPIKCAVFMSNGICSSVPYETQVGDFRAKGWPIYTVAFGSETNESSLRWMASETGGYFYSATTTDVQVVYDAIRTHIGGETLISQIEDWITLGETVLSSINIPEEVTSTTISLHWPGSDMELLLKSPDGVQIGPADAAADSNIFYTKTPTYAFYSLIDPMPGSWTAQVTALDVAPGGSEFGVTASAVTDISCNFLAFSDSYAPGSDIPIRVNLRGKVDGIWEPLLGANVTAYISSPSGNPDSVDLLDSGLNEDSTPNDGIYTGIYAGTDSAGSYALRAVATGTEPGLLAESFHIEIERNVRVGQYPISIDEMSLHPADGTTTLDTRSIVSCTVTGPLSNIDPGSILMKVDGDVVPHTFNPGSQAIAFAPPEDLFFGTHNAVVDVSDMSGTPCPQASWSFGVGPTLATGIPTFEWRIFSLPGCFSDPRREVILDDDFGQVCMDSDEDCRWMLYWCGGSHWFSEAVTPDSILCGHSYWVYLQPENPAITTILATTPPPTLSGNDEFSISLHKGWNMIATPRPHEIPWNRDILVKRYMEGEGDVVVPITAADQRQWMRAYLWEFDGNFRMFRWSAYNENGEIRPWEGYYVYALVEGLELILPSHECVLDPASRDDPAAEDQPGQDPDRAICSWTLQMDVCSGEYSDPGTVIGVSPTATDGVDYVDVEKPPTMGHAIRVTLAHPESDRQDVDFARDLRDTTHEQKVWWLSVEKGISGNEPVVLSWVGSNDLPGDLALTLYDPSSNQSIDMTCVSSYEIPIRELNSTHSLRICAFPRSQSNVAADEPSEFRLVGVSPNPMRDLLRVEYQMPAGGGVLMARVYNIRGQLVTAIESESPEAGLHTLAWDATDNAGNKVAPGMYICRLTFGDYRVSRKVVVLE